MAKIKERIERAVLEAAVAVEDYVGTGRLHKTVTEAGVKRKISYSNGEVRCSTSICERVKENSGLDCCSSHGSTDIHKEASEFSDLEEESGNISASTYGLERCRERGMDPRLWRIPAFPAFATVASSRPDDTPSRERVLKLRRRSRGGDVGSGGDAAATSSKLRQSWDPQSRGSIPESFSSNFSLNFSE